MQKLFDDFDDFLFFESTKVFLEIEERVLSKFCYEVDVCLIFIEMVQFDDVIVIEKAE